MKAVETKKRKKSGQKERLKSPVEQDEDQQLRERVRVAIKGIQKGMPIVGISEDQVFNNDPV